MRVVEAEIEIDQALPPVLDADLQPQGRTGRAGRFHEARAGLVPIEHEITIAVLTICRKPIVPGNRDFKELANRVVVAYRHLQPLPVLEMKVPSFIAYRN